MVLICYIVDHYLGLLSADVKIIYVGWLTEHMHLFSEVTLLNEWIETSCSLLNV